MPVARKFGLASISNLCDRLKSDQHGQIADQIIEAMTTNESFFFRDKLPFEHFSQTMLPNMLNARARDKRLRIWSAAASTGQEPYTLAMCLKDADARLGGWRVEMIGTDLSSEVLEKAKAGLYSQFEVQRGLPINYLLKHFTQIGDMWQISSELRAMVQYKKLNLLENFSSLGSFDIVFCRNVLIYFDNDAKIDILNRIRKTMPDDGYLVLGAAETVVGLTEAFKPVPDRRGLYQAASAGQSATAPASAAAGTAFGSRFQFAAGR
jgi:chemotaxis protein methyltransferase CheR